MRNPCRAAAPILAHADVARDVGLSVQRVRQTLCEARARMRRALAELESEEDA